ncbi:hypothetical protein CVT25_012614 [Psilocybe cyanescens]|uniref:Uncharacterized protein n=1 Tax=Psilocybe cyanescens TaxID=93625 RepID=A0A409XK55_PSICY|nr:hypothetical protein CVT25_012614 [Psilocybe cyanescens]
MSGPRVSVVIMEDDDDDDEDVMTAPSTYCCDSGARVACASDQRSISLGRFPLVEEHEDTSSAEDSDHIFPSFNSTLSSAERRQRIAELYLLGFGIKTIGRKNIIQYGACKFRQLACEWIYGNPDCQASEGFVKHIAASYADV